MTKVELSCLLYLETRAVDHAGLVDQQCLNDEDRAIMIRWNDEGFVESGRVCSDSVKAQTGRPCTTWVKLSTLAFIAAHAERRARAERMWGRKSYQTTAEKRGSS